MATFTVDEILGMSDEVRRTTLSTTNGAVGSLRATVARFETRYEMTSSEMRQRYARGEMGDTPDTSEWLMILRTLDRVG